VVLAWDTIPWLEIRKCPSGRGCPHVPSGWAIATVLYVKKFRKGEILLRSPDPGVEHPHGREPDDPDKKVPDVEAEGVIHRAEDDEHARNSDEEEEDESKGEPQAGAGALKSCLHPVKGDGKGEGEYEGVCEEEEHDRIVPCPHTADGKDIVGRDEVSDHRKGKLGDEEEDAAGDSSDQDLLQVHGITGDTSSSGWKKLAKMAWGDQRSKLLIRGRSMPYRCTYLRRFVCPIIGA